MAEAVKPPTSDPPPPPTKPKKPKPPSRRDSQRERDKKQRDSISEIEETIKRIGSHKGIIGTVICNGDGIPLRSTLDKATTLQYAAFLTPLAGRARIITKSHNPKDEMVLLRIRTRSNAIIANGVWRNKLSKMEDSRVSRLSSTVNNDPSAQSSQGMVDFNRYDVDVP